MRSGVDSRPKMPHMTPMGKMQVRIDKELLGPLTIVCATTGLSVKAQVNLILREHMAAKCITVPKRK